MDLGSSLRSDVGQERAPRALQLVQELEGLWDLLQANKHLILHVVHPSCQISSTREQRSNGHLGGGARGRGSGNPAWVSRAGDNFVDPANCRIDLVLRGGLDVKVEWAVPWALGSVSRAEVPPTHRDEGTCRPVQLAQSGALRQVATDVQVVNINL